MNKKSSLILLFLLLVTGRAFAIDPVYEGPNGIRAQVFATNCLSCHSSDLVGEARNGAPPSANWDTYEAALPNAPLAIVRAVDQMTMPPPSSGIPTLNEEQQAAMLAWQSAGFPQAATPNSSFDGTKLTLPVVNVGSQKFNATLGLTLLAESPTGFGFVLESAELTTASSDNAATYAPETGQALIPSVEVVQDGTLLDTVDTQLTLVAGSAPMLFILEEPGFPNISTDASYSYNTQNLTLPVVIVGNQKFRAALKHVPWDNSPIGIGFLLGAAELTTANSDTAVTFAPETGQVILPFVDLIQNGVSLGPVNAEMELVPGTNPLLFSLINYTPIAQ